MKKLFVIMLTVLLAVAAFTGCSAEKEPEGPTKYDNYNAIMESLGKVEGIDLSSAAGVLASVKEKGVLVVGTSPDYPAAEFVDAENGNVYGCEMILAQYIANSLGVDLKIETMDFSGILAAVDTGKVDLGISGFGYKEDRAQNYEISHGYQAASSKVAHHTILVLAEDIDKYNSLADFAGMTIDAQANSLQEMYVTDQIENATIQKVASLDQAILDLLSGKVKAVALDGTTAKNYAEQSNGKLVSVYVEKGIEFDLSLYADYSGNIIIAKKGETSLMDAVNQVVDSMNNTEDLYKNWYLAACEVAEISPDLDAE